MSRDDYEPGAAHPDPAPVPTAFVICECGFEGDVPTHQTAPGVPASMAGPEEPATFEATCPDCAVRYDISDDGQEPPI